MFCPKCGTKLPDGAQFCGNCGASLAYLNESAGSQPQTPGESYEADVAEAAAAQTVSTVVPSNTDSSVATFAGTAEPASAHYKYWKQYNGNDPFMTGENWTAITDVTFNKPYTTTYSYNDAGVLISAACEYDDMDNPDYPNASTNTGALEFNDAGMLIKRTYDGVNTYRSDTNETSGVEEFEYTRVFVQKDAAETQSMLTVVDPVAPVRQHSILGSNYRFLDDQQDVVRDIVIGSALYNYM